MPKGSSTPACLTILLSATLVAQAHTVMAGVATREEVCDARVDYFLGVGDYPEAAKLHRRVVAAHPEDALAHYRLGFAYGMLAGPGEELAEYRRAASLSLKQWE